MTTSESIIIGVLSGILTSFIIYLAVIVLQKLVLPWYQSLIYKGADISGNWECLGATKGQDAHFTINQKANAISGIATYVSREAKADYDKTRVFTIKGEIRDRFITFSIQHADRRRLGASVFLLQVVKDGTSLVGARCSYAIDISKIQATETTLVRTSEEAHEPSA